MSDDVRPDMVVREGDQGLPVPNDRTSCQERYLDRINREMPARMELGLRRYGTLLQPLNGRDFGRDALDELLDLSVYLEGMIAEREALLDLLFDVAAGESNVRERAAVLLLSMGESVTFPQDPK